MDRANEMTALLACRFLQTKRIDDGSQYRRIGYFEKPRIAHDCEHKVIALCCRLCMDRRYGFTCRFVHNRDFCFAFATVCSNDITDSLNYAAQTDKDIIMVDRRP